MKTDHDDGELRELYQRLKLEDEKLARPFAEHFSGHPRSMRPRGGSRPRINLSHRLAAVALALVLLAGYLVARWHRASLPRPQAEVSLAGIFRWQAPTDFLLHTAENPLLRSVPRFGGPLTVTNSFGGSETK
jgi:hypothetical protein